MIDMEEIELQLIWTERNGNENRLNIIKSKYCQSKYEEFKTWRETFTMKEKGIEY